MNKNVKSIIGRFITGSLWALVSITFVYVAWYVMSLIVFAS